MSIHTNMHPETHPWIQQLLDKCIIDEKTGCVLFQGMCKKGIIHAKYNGKRINVTRLFIQLTCGEEITKMHVHKTCCNIRCLNLSHMQYEMSGVKYHATHTCNICGDKFDAYFTGHQKCMACYAGNRIHNRTKTARTSQSFHAIQSETARLEANVKIEYIENYLKNEVYIDYPTQHIPRESITDFIKRRRNEMIQERIDNISNEEW